MRVRTDMIGQDTKNMIGKDYTLREAEATDLPAIADLFSRHDYWAKDFASVRWKFLENPHGSARIFVAADIFNKIVGLVAYLPRRFTGTETGTFTVMQTVDVFVAEELRNKGVYSRIDQYARSHMNVPRIGFPNKLSIGFGLRSVWYILARLERWFFPVAVGPLVAKNSCGLLASLANVLSKAYAFLWLC
ncbi:MAG: GNAT family N-acetyltransferase, partial [Deltaproteobacteria bacterium]|nr:GNAT family N-acetyltransferase [Deltaproteobacteria bacterium]